MKLYVWHEVLCDYTCGVMFAMANDPMEAIKVILASLEYAYEYSAVHDALMDNPPKVYTKPIGFTVWGGG